MGIADLVRCYPLHRRARRYVFHYERVLGTSFELHLVATSARAARRAEAAALAAVDRLEPVLSGYTAESELARWQATADADVPVSDALADVLDAAERWRARTGGAFHPGAQALIARLRDRDDEASPAEAGDAGLASLLGALRGPLWTVDRDRGTARRLTRLPISLDAVAKGYIVAQAVAAAYASGDAVDVLLNVGGDIQHRGRRAVVAGVADPFAPAENAPLLAAVYLRDEALATSGGYRRGLRSGGRRVSHLVDARTGRPVERVVSASAVAPDCATADALSTAFSVLAPAESVALADATPGVACLVVEADGARTASAGWRARAVAPGAAAAA